MEITRNRFIKWLDQEHLNKWANSADERLIELFCKEILGAKIAKTDGETILLIKTKNKHTSLPLPDWYKPFYLLFSNDFVGWSTARRRFNGSNSS